ncbi:MAG: hypothetical protein CMP06_01775 [Xanthomonadales bacterium]|nr:hypothetical protein [Xanthomonadales bacterium]
MNIGQTLKAIRRSKRLTQKALAEQSGISESYISLVEKGQREPSLGVLDSICQQLDIPLSVFVLLAFDEGSSLLESDVAHRKVYESLRAFVKSELSLGQ